MRSILEELDLKESSSDNIRGWRLLPMKSKDLRASNLGELLEHALESARQFTKMSVVFLGMDSPLLELGDIVYGLTAASKKGTAVMCPADDGGYGMLCVPPNAPSSKIFRGVHWSHSLTAVSQLKALTDQNVPVLLGKLMHDIDEIDDVKQLCQRLGANKDKNEKDFEPLVLSLSSGGVSSNITSRHPLCFHTRAALVELGQLLPA